MNITIADEPFLCSEADRGWAAGFFDGEGYVGLSGTDGGRLRYANAIISQVDRRVLDKFHLIVGVGKIYGPFSTGKENHSNFYRWQCYGYEQTGTVFSLLQADLGVIKTEAFQNALAHKVENRPKQHRHSRKEIEAVLALLRSGQSVSQTARALGLTSSTVSSVKFYWNPRIPPTPPLATNLSDACLEYV